MSASRLRRVYRFAWRSSRSMGFPRSMSRSYAMYVVGALAAGRIPDAGWPA
jgi:hypothetical protein